MRDIDSEKTKQAIQRLSLEELEFTLHRYCGPSNIILCEKKFGFRLRKKIIEQEIERRQVEVFLLGQPDSGE